MTTAAPAARDLGLRGVRAISRSRPRGVLVDPAYEPVPRGARCTWASDVSVLFTHRLWGGWIRRGQTRDGPGPPGHHLRSSRGPMSSVRSRSLAAAAVAALGSLAVTAGLAGSP